MHFVFGQLKFAVADIFVREKFDFLETNHLGTHQNIAVADRIEPKAPKRK